MEGIKHLSMNYQLKPGTSTSYYFKSGDAGYLPKRICITTKEFAPINGKPKQKAGQLKATFTRQEESIYKRGAGSIHSSIFALIKPEPSIIGTGDIAGTRDLLVFQSLKQWDEITIHIFIDGLFYEVELIREILKKPLP